MDTRDLVMIGLGCIVVWVALFGILGSYIARQTGRNESEGFWFSVLLGPLGVLIVLLLPPPKD
jgi:hypothetical protein